ncbi:MAG: hypothetical protein KGJ77_02600 [Acidobacteriota bacterium]|nr:hypothetical protein [Acidobacteriota bacterium]
MVPSRRRARWRRRLGTGLVPALAAAAVLSVVVAFAAGALSQVSRVSGPYHRTIDRSWAVLADAVASRSQATGASLVSLLQSISTASRPGFFSTLDGAAADASAEERALDAAVPPAPVGGSDAGCEQAVAGRAGAASSIRDALEGLLGGPSGGAALGGTTALEDVTLAVGELQAADRAWASCRQALRRGPGTASLRASRWLSDPGAWSPAFLGAIVNATAGTATLASRHSLGIVTMTTDPASLPGSGTGVVPATNSLTVHVVVANRGNVDEPAVQVRVGLSGGAGRSQPSATAIVAVRAGRTTTVVLGPLAVAPGASYTLQVTAAPPSGSGATGSSVGFQVATVPTTTTTRPTTTTTAPGR